MQSYFCANPKSDELVKSQKTPLVVIPAKAGIQSYQLVPARWTLLFFRIATFYETVKSQYCTGREKGWAKWMT